MGKFGGGPARPQIAYVISARGVGGAEKLFMALLAEGERRGWEQLVLNPFADSQSAVFRSEINAPYEARECTRFLEVPKLRHWLGTRLKRFQPDIVHVALFHAAVLMATLPRLGERRLLTHAYGDALLQLSHPWLRMKLDRWSVRQYDHISAVSDSVKSFLDRSHEVPPPPVGRIWLGWDGKPRPRSPPRARPPTIVCVAVLRHEKGHDTLLAAFARVREAMPGARLVLVGDGPYRAQVEAMIASRGLQDCVVMKGRVHDIWIELADADVFALASPAEAFGIAVLEAMAAGLPVIASRVGGIPELVNEGVTGELFRPEDHEELAVKLIALLGKPDRLRQMSQAAEVYARGMHMDRTADLYFELYEQLLRGVKSGDSRLVSASGMRQRNKVSG